MKRMVLGAAVVALGITAVAMLQSGDDGRSGVANAATNAPCQVPSAQAATPEQTAWQLFVAVNCRPTRVQTNALTWETWIEQSRLYHQTSLRLKGQRLHASVKAATIRRRTQPLGATLKADTACGPMRGAPPAPPALVANPQICEEVHLNPIAVRFITSDGNRYDTRAGQSKAAQRGTDIEFPDGSVEVKVDWIPLTDFAQPTYTCASPPPGVRVEAIGGTCYAMAGFHIAAKLKNTPDWLWTSFEAQSVTTNPLRCKTFGPCYDPWGSDPATSNGGTAGYTALTASAKDLIAAAKLPKELANYRLDGVQLAFFKAGGKAPTILGDSIIEGENVGMKPNTSSCITCHSYSSVKTDGTDGLTLLPEAPVGARYKVPQGWIARDFVWSMMLATPSPF